MRWLVQVGFNLRSLFRKRKLDEQLSEEIRSHVELATEANLAKGMAPDEARYTALRDCGNPAGALQNAREERGWIWMEQLLQDLRLAVRQLTKAPGFTLVAVLTLAFGIGVNTSMFSIIDSILSQSQPFPHPDRIVMITFGQAKSGGRGQFSATELREIREHVTGLSGLVAIRHDMYGWSAEGQAPKTLPGVAFSSELQEVFQLPPEHGRFFVPEDFEPGKNQVMLVSFGFWQSQLGGDPKAVGRSLRINSEDVMIVGVMPERFSALWFGGASFFRPLNFSPEQLRVRDFRNLSLLGRLKPDETTTVIAAQLAPLAAQLAKDYPQDFAGFVFRATTLAEMMKSRSPGVVWLLGGLALFVLLIACANLANLQLARATSAMRDFAVRTVLGASRSRLVTQQFTESLLLSLAGGALGVLVGIGVNHFVEVQVGLKVMPGTRLFVITFVISLFTGLLFGVVPAFFVARVDVNSALKSQTRGATGSRGLQRMRHALIIGEVALAMVLLSGAAMMNRGFSRVFNEPVGWDTARIAMARVRLPENRYLNTAHRWEFYRQLLQRVAAVPGVEQVTVGSELPMFGHFNPHGVFTDAALATAPNNPLVEQMMVTPGYFPTLGIRLREGRMFSEELKPGDPVQVVVDESLTKLLFPGKSPLGQRVGTYKLADGKILWHEIVGVVGNVSLVGNVAQPPSMPTMYRAFSQEIWPQAILLVRSAHPEALPETIRKAAAEIDPDLALEQVAPISQMMREINRSFIMIAHLLAGFAALGLILAVIGLYGVISHIVAQQTAEFGIRYALGARPWDVTGSVLKRGLVLTAIGLGVGLLGAAGLNRVLWSFLPRLVGVDPLSIAGMAAVLLTVATLASWLPARRAAKVDPMVALRAE